MLDLARSRDLSAFVLLFEGEGVYHVKPWLFLPEDTAKESQNPYQEWARDGHLILTPGNVLDDDTVISTILHACDFNVQEICFDRYSSSNIIKHLLSENIKIMKGSADNKVDRIVSHVMAFGAMIAGKSVFRSRYEDHPELDVIDFTM
jgi:phage terminase large subunit-like protein